MGVDPHSRDHVQSTSLDVDILKGDIFIGSVGGEDARQATETEHNLTFVQALRLYPTAVGWSIFFSLGIIMTAFDPQLLGSVTDE